MNLEEALINALLESDVHKVENYFESISVEAGYHEWLIKYEDDIIYTFNVDGLVDNTDELTEEAHDAFAYDIAQLCAEQNNLTEEQENAIAFKVKEAMVTTYGVDV